MISCAYKSDHLLVLDIVPRVKIIGVASGEYKIFALLGRSITWKYTPEGWGNTPMCFIDRLGMRTGWEKAT